MADLVVLDLYLSNAAYNGGLRRAAQRKRASGWAKHEMKGERRRRRRRSLSWLVISREHDY